ncbi:MAG: DNA methyltransferase, partial [Candidatus Anstonellales archaeon]
MGSNIVVDMELKKKEKINNTTNNCPYIGMEEITWSDYKSFIEERREITIEDIRLEIGRDWKIKEYQPKNFELETTTVWSFPKRGEWATHYLNARYRGNWAPKVPRNLILRYTKEGETVLDAFVGSGTTLIEAKLLDRNAIGVDINKEAIMLTMDRLKFSYNKLRSESKNWIKTYVGDARNLDKIKNESIDLIATHPP